MELRKFRDEVDIELQHILDYWENYTVDLENGGFFGFINHQNEVDNKANKGLILNTRILWTFSAAYQSKPNPKYSELAKRAFNYIIDRFYDTSNEGFYWMLDYQGKPIEKKKQIYGQAFCIYSFVEYYKISGNTKALYHAIQLFMTLEKYSFDTLQNGYFEAYSETWKVVEDLRLSDKDANEKKTMNTHLHILEAYTNLYSVWKNDLIQAKLENLIEVFQKHIIHPTSYYQHLFLDENWNVKSSIISYGHDIETSWLLWKAVKSLNKMPLTDEIKELAIKIGEASLKGIDTNNGLNNEYDFGKQHLDDDKHWWIQAEAVVGYFNVYELTNDEKYLNQAMLTWEFIKENILDKQNGEWFWGKKANGDLMSDEKVGFWKCPYHNARACMEIVKRVDQMLNKKNEVLEKQIV